MFWAGFGGPIVVSEAVWSDFGSVRTSSGWLFSISVAGTSGGPEGPEAHADLCWVQYCPPRGRFATGLQWQAVYRRRKVECINYSVDVDHTRGHQAGTQIATSASSAQPPSWRVKGILPVLGSLLGNVEFWGSFAGSGRAVCTDTAGRPGARSWDR